MAKQCLPEGQQSLHIVTSLTEQNYIVLVRGNLEDSGSSWVWFIHALCKSIHTRSY